MEIFPQLCRKRITDAEPGELVKLKANRGETSLAFIAHQKTSENTQTFLIMLQPFYADLAPPRLAGPMQEQAVDVFSYGKNYRLELGAASWAIDGPRFEESNGLVMVDGNRTLFHVWSPHPGVSAGYYDVENGILLTERPSGPALLRIPDWALYVTSPVRPSFSGELVLKFRASD